MASLPANLALSNVADGASIVASDHRNNYSAIQAYVNALNVILSGGTSGQVLGSSGGTTIGWQAGTTTYRKTTTKTVNTSVAATDLLNAEISVAAGVLGTTGSLRLTAWGDWLQNSGGAAVAPRFQLTLGGTTLFDTGAGPSATANATRGNWNLTATILNAGSASAQTAYLSFRIYGPGGLAATQGSFTTGEGYYMAPVATLASGFGDGYNTAAVNTALASALVLNVINGSANAAYETKLAGAVIEVI